MAFVNALPSRVGVGPLFVMIGGLVIPLIVFLALMAAVAGVIVVFQYHVLGQSLGLFNLHFEVGSADHPLNDRDRLEQVRAETFGFGTCALGVFAIGISGIIVELSDTPGYWVAVALVCGLGLPVAIALLAWLWHRKPAESNLDW